MSLSLALLPAFTNHIKAQFIDKTQCVAEAQERFLMRLLKAHQKTALGKELNLEAIRTVEQFRDRVPILSYEAYVPYVERIVAGEKAVLNPAPVNYINLTSGSTGNKKLVPVTQPFQASLRRADITSIGCNDPLILDKELRVVFLFYGGKINGNSPSSIQRRI